MKNKTLINSVRFVRYLAKARSKAAFYLAEPERLMLLIKQVGRQAKKLKEDTPSGTSGTLVEQSALLSRLLLAYSRGEYKVIPWESVLMATAAMVYFLMPFDAFSDWLIGLGFIDDAIIMGMAFKALKTDLMEFSVWENERLHDLGVQKCDSEAS
jgi:uncharacterized membrane protein YkvA (DUF1232 family)